jgi:hypothetical protein
MCETALYPTLKLNEVHELPNHERGTKPFRPFPKLPFVYQNQG